MYVALSYQTVLVGSHAKALAEVSPGVDRLGVVTSEHLGGRSLTPAAGTRPRRDKGLAAKAGHERFWPSWMSNLPGYSRAFKRETGLPPSSWRRTR
jgi:AraC-like DNA-binding protein